MNFKKNPGLPFLIVWLTIIIIGSITVLMYPVYMIPFVIELFIIINISTFFLYALDKLLASAQTRRVPERTLHLTAFLFGSPGALLAMNLFRHKTQKTSFQLMLAWVVLVQVLIATAIVYYLYPSFFNFLQ